jgi:D-beta-D-heptose 7-phosphate kinase/D-beta-D-heptose 1-phosphate adenosyltransferase
MSKKIIVIGDIILDINHCVDTNRIAAESNIPVYNVINTTHILGGAANVAKNINNLYNNMSLVSIIGDDINGELVSNMLSESNIENKLFVDNRKTTTKTRLIHENNIVNRYDNESTCDITTELEESILNYLFELTDIYIIVISDYNKGLITNSLCKKIIQYSNENNIYTFIDPRTNDYMKYKDCFLFKPNLLEGKTISGCYYKNEITETIEKTLNCKHIVLTCGEDGIFYKNNIYKQLNNRSTVVDVTGCGDTVLSILVYIFLLENDIIKAIKIANYIAKKSTTFIGNYNLNQDDIDEFIDTIIYDYDKTQLVNLTKIYGDSKIIFTNGCFDIIHSAHLKILNYSKKQGDVLIVGLNSDESIKRIKGESRPINNIKERCELLAQLDIIDHIIIFNDDSPLNILSVIKPNTIIKGGDYTKDSIIGKEYADNIIIFDYINNISTTNTILKINNISKL